MNLDDILDLYPTMRHALQPPKRPRIPGTFRFSACDDWQAFIDRLAEFRFRQSDPRNWVGPFHCIGDCLSPFSDDHDLSWFDPTLVPQEDDFVLIGWGPQALASDDFQRARADWRAKYGTEPGPIATKHLRGFGSRWILAVRNSFYELDDCRVLGVLVHEERAGAALHAPVSCAIGPNAATQIYVAQDDGPDTFNPSSGGDGYLSLNGTGIDSASVLNGSLTIDAQIVDPSTTLAGITLQVTWSGGSESTPTAQPQHTDRRAYSFQHTFTTLPQDTAWTMRVGMNGNASITVQRAALRAEVIKR